MFSHIKAEEFVNLLEGMPLSANRTAHLGKCARCSETWASMRAIHAEVATLDSDILEPDWSDFRFSVRNELLSRSVQRSSAVRRWTGWPIRPAAAWAVSLLLAVGLTSGALMWWMNQDPPSAVVSVPAAPKPAGSTEIAHELDVWSQHGLFDEITQLEESQEEALRRLLQAAQETAVQE